MLRASVIVLFCAAVTSSVATAQNLCPAGVNSTKLICMLDQNIVLSNVVSGQSVAPFAGDFNGAFSGLNSAIGRQSTLLPSASPSSGITFAWDAVSKTFVATTDSYGPVLTDRAETIGRGRVFIGFSYQHFNFDALDGVNLRNMPVVLTQPDSVNPNDSSQMCSLNGDNVGSCGYVRDVIRTNNRIDLTVHQFTTYVSYGLTNRIDISVAIPIENMHMAISSDATMVNNSLANVHAFVSRPDCPDPCLQSSFLSSQNASGIGDITLRVKGIAWKGERSSLALGVDVRTPTGDQLNFLGAGAAGVRPFVNWSYHSRVSPHAVVGYEVNGSSLVAGDPTTGTKERLPSELTYGVGADTWLTKRISAAFDLIGQEVFQTTRSSVGTFTEPAPCTDSSCTSFASPNQDQALLLRSASYNVTSASIGGKVRPLSRLLLTGNILIQLNGNSGLRARYVPLFGASYTF